MEWDLVSIRLGILFGTLLSHTSYNVHNIAIISIIISILLLVLIRNKNTEIKNAAINRLNKNTIINNINKGIKNGSINPFKKR